jgi:dTDP-glucose 4,6-dehydratase
LFRLLQSELHEPTNIGNPEEWTVLQMAKAIRELAGSSVEIVHEDLPVDDPKIRQPDTSRARKELGWSPSTSIHEGLGTTLEYFRRKILDRDAQGQRT